jgi:hypothetical protein
MHIDKDIFRTMLQIAYRRLLIAEPGQELLVSLKTSSGSYRRRDDSAQFRVFATIGDILSREIRELSISIPTTQWSR